MNNWFYNTLKGRDYPEKKSSEKGKVTFCYIPVCLCHLSGVLVTTFSNTDLELMALKSLDLSFQENPEVTSKNEVATSKLTFL